MVTAAIAGGIALLTNVIDWPVDALLVPTPSTTAASPAPTSSAKAGTTSLVELDPLSVSSPFFNEQTALIAGAVYPDSIVIQFDGSEPIKRLEYSLDRRYTGLTATVSLEDASTPSKDARLDFFGDGRLLKTEKPQVGVAHPLRLRLDEVTRLTIVASSGTEKCCVNIAVGFPVMATK